MNILIAGATGFVGQTLVEQLLADKHKITVLGRSTNKIESIFLNNVHAINWAELLEMPNDEFNIYDLIINLSGAGIADKTWSSARKVELRESRIETTKTLVSKINQSTKKHRLINFSAVGIYQQLKPTTHTFEESDKIVCDNFLAQLVSDWEEEAKKLNENKHNLVILRLAIVLERSGGLLKKVLPSSRLGLGTQLGSGDQAFPWVSLHDLIRVIRFLIENENIKGTYNISSPNNTNQKEFTKTLCKVLHRPFIFRAPSSLLNLVLGDFSKLILLSGQNVSSTKIVQSGFKFENTSLEDLLKDLVT